MSNYEEIMSAALALPADSRAMLAEELLESLAADEQERINELWVEEAERRDRELEDGTVKALPGEEVMNRLRVRLKP